MTVFIIFNFQLSISITLLLQTSGPRPVTVSVSVSIPVSYTHLAELGRSSGCRLRCGQEAGLDRFGSLREGGEVEGNSFVERRAGDAGESCGCNDYTNKREAW